MSRIPRTHVKTLFCFSSLMTLTVFRLRNKNETPASEDEVEHYPEWMAVNKLSQIIPKTELVHLLN